MARLSTDPQALAAAVKGRDKRAVARAISIVEDGGRAAEALIEALHGDGGRAAVIGITGPPGAGKSTLVAALVKEIRASGDSVAVIAVDPTSPFSGGALLGDRVRMDRIASDDGVFIRSMATRGSLGGLSRKTVDALIVLDAAGYDRIIIETVGVGQSEVEVASTADTTAVILSPESGDGIQAMKAGLMEVGDVFCVNKSDREGADRLVRELQNVASLPASRRSAEADPWFPPVFKTQARSGEGIAELLSGLDAHRAHLLEADRLADGRARSARQRILAIAGEALSARLREVGAAAGATDRLASAVARREVTPYAAARELVQLTLEQGP